MCERVLWEELLFIQVKSLVGGELVQVELDEDSSSSFNILDFRCSVELDAGSVGGASGRKRVALSTLNSHSSYGDQLVDIWSSDC